jgi:four helix bundle suffix protein
MQSQNMLFDKKGGYRKLFSFTFATIIHLGTIDFCKRFISYKDDPLGKTSGQMIGAARSGRQNIIEGSERSSTSKQTEIKLTDVAKASLAELLGDYEMYLAEKESIPWSKNDSNHQAICKIKVPPFEYTDDAMHDYWCYFQEVREQFDPWIKNSDSTIVANAMIVLIQRTMAMLYGQIQHQGKAFLQKGGFNERMYSTRKTERDTKDIDPDAPLCPECDKPMVKRKARTGTNADSEFWGCSAFPDCKGTRKI